MDTSMNVEPTNSGELSKPSPIGKRILSEADWRLISKRIHEERCVPFLGAGASVAQGQERGLPTAFQLASALAQDSDYPGSDKGDLFRVAQYFQMVNDPYELRSFIRDELKAGDNRPTAVHNTLAALPFRYVLTTNFDKLMEKAFEDARKTPQIALYQLHGDNIELPIATVKDPLVYKLHGTVDKLETMIVTEDDVVDFLSCVIVGDPPLPPVLKKLFEDNSILFIGYGLKDWNIRVMLRAIRGQGRKGPPDIRSFAIQKCPDELGLAQEWETCVMYWDKKENLRCFDMDAIEFASELHKQYKKHYGE
jgi:hypothetical protein